METVNIIINKTHLEKSGKDFFDGKSCPLFQCAKEIFGDNVEHVGGSAIYLKDNHIFYLKTPFTDKDFKELRDNETEFKTLGIQII
jgi:hypothetical protein